MFFNLALTFYLQAILYPCVVTGKIRGTKCIFMLNVRDWGAQSSARILRPENIILLK